MTTRSTPRRGGRGRRSVTPAVVSDEAGAGVGQDVGLAGRGVGRIDGDTCAPRLEDAPARPPPCRSSAPSPAATGSVGADAPGAQRGRQVRRARPASSRVGDDLVRRARRRGRRVCRPPGRRTARRPCGPASWSWPVAFQAARSSASSWVSSGSRPERRGGIGGGRPASTRPDVAQQALDAVGSNSPGGCSMAEAQGARFGLPHERGVGRGPATAGRRTSAGSRPSQATWYTGWRTGSGFGAERADEVVDGGGPRSAARGGTASATSPPSRGTARSDATAMRSTDTGRSPRSPAAVEAASGARSPASAGSGQTGQPTTRSLASVWRCSTVAHRARTTASRPAPVASVRRSRVAEQRRDRAGRRRRRRRGRAHRDGWRRPAARAGAGAPSRWARISRAARAYGRGPAAVCTRRGSRLVPGWTMRAAPTLPVRESWPGHRARGDPPTSTPAGTIRDGDDRATRGRTSRACRRGRRRRPTLRAPRVEAA